MPFGKLPPVGKFHNIVNRMNPTSPPIIYRDVRSLSKLIAGFKAQTATTSERFSGLCGFDGFIDTFVRLQTPPSMAVAGVKP